MKASLSALRTDLGGYRVDFAVGNAQGSQYVDLIVVDRLRTPGRLSLRHRATRRRPECEAARPRGPYGAMRSCKAASLHPTRKPASIGLSVVSEPSASITLASSSGKASAAACLTASAMRLSTYGLSNTNRQRSPHTGPALHSILCWPLVLEQVQRLGASIECPARHRTDRRPAEGFTRAGHRRADSPVLRGGELSVGQPGQPPAGRGVPGAQAGACQRRGHRRLHRSHGRHRERDRLCGGLLAQRMRRDRRDRHDVDCRACQTGGAARLEPRLRIRLDPEADRGSGSARPGRRGGCRGPARRFLQRLSCPGAGADRA